MDGVPCKQEIPAFSHSLRFVAPVLRDTASQQPCRSLARFLLCRQCQGQIDQAVRLLNSQVSLLSDDPRLHDFYRDHDKWIANRCSEVVKAGM